MNEEKAIDAILLSLLSIYHNTEDPTKPLLEYLNADISFNKIYDSFERLNLPKEAREIINLMSYSGKMIKTDEDDEDDVLEELWGEVGQEEQELSTLVEQLQSAIDGLGIETMSNADITKMTQDIKIAVEKSINSQKESCEEIAEKMEEIIEAVDEDEPIPIVICLDNTGMEDSFSVGIEYLFVECNEDEENNITEYIDEAVLIVVEDMLGNKKIVMKERFDISGVEKWTDWKKEQERIEDSKNVKVGFIEKEDFNYYKAFEKIQEWRELSGKDMPIEIMKQYIEREINKYEDGYGKYNELSRKYYAEDYKDYKIRWKHE